MMNKTAQNSRFGIGKKIASAFLSAAMLATSFTGLGGMMAASSTPVDAASASDYGLMDNSQDGVILHAWDWSFNNIKANMAKIAAAGYTSVQTSVIQQAKEGTKGKGNNVWWLYYQPANFTIDNTGNSALGNKAEFAAMCEEAHKYGIHVIVDVVANHLGNNSGYDKAPAIPSDIKDDSSCWHDLWNQEINYGSRYSITHGSMGGLPDLNTENPKIQNLVKTYLKECIDCGADGFRFDAAKHIGVPNDTDNAGGDFWPNVIGDATSYYKTKGTFSSGLYCYGEILDGTGGPSISQYTQYMSVTDNRTGNGIRGDVAGHNANGAATSNYSLGAGASKTVLWAESHDTYSNDSKESTGVSDSDINKTWALVASRNSATALYFARTAGWRNGNIGDILSTQCFNPEVAEVNKFHNYFNGQSEYLSSSGSIAYNERGTSGVVLVNCSGGSQSVSVKANKMADGTYKDQVSGNTFTVSGGTISGQIGNTGIAVVYNATPVTKSAIVSADPGSTSFTSSTLSVKLGVKNADSGSYTTSEGKSGTYTNGQTITIGSSTAVGGSVTVTLSATGEDGVKKTETYTYTKKDPNAVTTIYFDNSSYKWSNVYAYVANSITDDPQPSPTPTPSGEILFTDALGWGNVKAYFFADGKPVGAEWPGTAMTSNGKNEYNQDFYKISIPSGAKCVIFNNGSAQTVDITLTGVTGYYCTGEQENGKYKVGSWTVGGAASSSWPGEKMTLDSATGYYKYVVPDSLANGKVIFSDGASDTTNRYPARNGGGLSIGGKSMLFSAGNSWKEYSSTPDPEVPTVTSNKSTGSSFTTETMDITLTLANADSGTYSVDGGPTKTFTGSKTVTIGEGKIGDSTVTVACTATKGSTKKNYTFTYNKKYQVKTTSTSASLPAAYYATNPTGVGKQATITIDGDASDWSEDMLIAKGGAWDVANHWKGGHENCVLDTTALYAAWDDNNLYIAWQMVNTCDTWANSGDGPLSDGGRVLDVPLILALSIDSSSTSMSNKNTSGGSIWGQKMGLTFKTHVDRLFYMSGKPGLGKPSMFKAVDSNGNTDYTTGCVGFTEGGIEYKMATTNISSKIMGLNNSQDPDDVFSASSDWVDYKTYAGSSGKHDTKYDSFYEMKIPLSTLGISKDYITKNGIGAMLVATRGESALDCIPFDPSMIDNATGDYSADPSTSLEKEDIDNITVSLASIGNGTINPSPDPDPDPDPDPTTPLQVNFGTDKSAPQLTTTALTIKGIGIGGTAPYKYEFSVDNKVVKASNTTATYTWKPGTAGKHTMKCVITDSTGATATVTKTFTAEGEDEPDPDPDPNALVSESTVSATTVEKGQPVVITGIASGGKAPYRYTFKYKKSTDDIYIQLGDTFSSKNSQTFYPHVAGTFVAQVDIRDANGTIVKQSFKVKVSSTTYDLTNTSKLNKSEIGVGEFFKMSAVKSGGKAPFTYTFLFKRAGNTKWNIIGTEWGTKTSATLTPTGEAEYDMRVLIKDGSGRVATKSFKGTCSGTAALANNSTISATTGAVNTKVTLTGKALGGKAPYKYAYYYKLGDGSWTTVAAYSTNTTASFTPAAAGKYTIRIKVKDSAETVVNKDFTYTATTGSALSNTSKLSASTVSAGTKVTIKGGASGGTSPYYYSYYYKRSTNTKWNLLGTEFGTATSASFTPGSAAKYDVKVIVKDKTGKTVEKTMTLTAT